MNGQSVSQHVGPQRLGWPSHEKTAVKVQMHTAIPRCSQHVATHVASARGADVYCLTAHCAHVSTCPADVDAMQGLLAPAGFALHNNIHLTASHCIAQAWRFLLETVTQLADAVGQLCSTHGGLASLPAAPASHNFSNWQLVDWVLYPEMVSAKGANVPQC